MLRSWLMGQGGLARESIRALLSIFSVFVRKQRSFLHRFRFRSFFLSRFLSSSVAGHGVVVPRAMADLTMARSLTGAASATRGRFPRDEAASAMFVFSEGGGVIRRRGLSRKMVR